MKKPRKILGLCSVRTPLYAHITLGALRQIHNKIPEDFRITDPLWPILGEIKGEIYESIINNSGEINLYVL